jgi:hypothetical protein
MHPDKIKNIFSLSAEDRYGYLVKRAADFEELWLIHETGRYVTLADDNGNTLIPVWPEKEFAELFLKDDWQNYSVVRVEIYEFIDWLDELNEDNIKIAAFPKEDMKGIFVTADDMKNHLLHELQQYE